MIWVFYLTKETLSIVNDPLAQTVTVNYASKTYTFEIKIKYSNVSIIKQRAEELSVLDWSKDTLPAISDEQGGNALDALEMYYDLVSAEKELISEEEQDCIVRAAAVYGYGKWADEVKSYEHTFTVDEKGKITFVGESYDVAVADYAKLSSSTAAVFELGDFLTDVAKDYKDVTLTGETTVAGYLSGVYGSTGFAAVRSQVKYMIDLYDTLKTNVVGSWENNTTSFNNFSTQISAVLRYITSNQYKNASDAQLYKIVTTWHIGKCAEKSVLARTSGNVLSVHGERHLSAGADEPECSQRYDAVHDVLFQRARRQESDSGKRFENGKMAV